jgi:hypothetical protein
VDDKAVDDDDDTLEFLASVMTSRRKEGFNNKTSDFEGRKTFQEYCMTSQEFLVLS